jgi:acetyl-CoA C-acetyltransferase
VPEAVIVSAVRSPIGRAAKGSLASMRPDDLTTQVVREALLPGATVNRYCASSLQSTRMAFHAVKAGEGDAFV